jgi:hypothetical protein
VGRDTGEETFGPHLLPDNPEHLLLQVNGEDLSGVADLFCKPAGEESRPAPEVEYAVAGLHKPLREPVRAVEEPAQARVEVAGAFSREDLVPALFLCIFSGTHTEWWEDEGDNGSVHEIVA